ncbi:MAG: hypothetical protein SGPRY_014118, partial [Prymnesium sp.]
DVATLQATRADLGNPSRGEIKSMLMLSFSESNRVAVASASLKTYMSFLGDEGQMMAMVGTQPTDEDKRFILEASYRFKGSKTEVEGYMKKVADLLHQGESLGYPSQERVVQVLDEMNLVYREAQKKLRDEHWKQKDVELKQEYRRNLGKRSSLTSNGED